MECINDKPSKKLIRSKSGLRIVVTDDDHKSPFIIGEPQWTPDKDVSNCTKCSAKFGFTTRKHHCRRCGNIYCSACCDKKLELPRMCFIDPVRVCCDCAPATTQENKFFESHLKILTNGASFVLNQSSDYKQVLNSCDENVVVLCKLSQDHRYIVFDVSVNGDNDCGSNSQMIPQLLPVNLLRLDQIKSLRIYNDVPVSGLISVELEYSTSTPQINNPDKQSTNVLRLSTSFEGPSSKQITLSWLTALQQALKMLFENESVDQEASRPNDDNIR